MGADVAKGGASVDVAYEGAFRGVRSRCNRRVRRRRRSTDAGRGREPRFRGEASASIALTLKNEAGHRG